MIKDQLTVLGDLYEDTKDHLNAIDVRVHDENKLFKVFQNLRDIRDIAAVNVPKGRIYIAGKIGGLQYSEYTLKFSLAEIELLKRGFETVSPLTLPHQHERSWKSYMKEDLEALKSCDHLFALSNWEDSRGARIEVWFAKRYNKTIIYQ